MLTWLICNVHLGKPLKIEVLSKIELCYYIFRAYTQLLLTTLSQ
jgi:hypothetical protein